MFCSLLWRVGFRVSSWRIWRHWNRDVTLQSYRVKRYMCTHVQSLRICRLLDCSSHGLQLTDIRVTVWRLRMCQSLQFIFRRLFDKCVNHVFVSLLSCLARLSIVHCKINHGLFVELAYLFFGAEDTLNSSIDISCAKEHMNCHVFEDYKWHVCNSLHFGHIRRLNSLLLLCD